MTRMDRYGASSRHYDSSEYDDIYPSGSFDSGVSRDSDPSSSYGHPRRATAAGHDRSTGPMRSRYDISEYEDDGPNNSVRPRRAGTRVDREILGGARVRRGLGSRFEAGTEETIRERRRPTVPRANGYPSEASRRHDEHDISEYDQYCDKFGYFPSRSPTGRAGPRTDAYGSVDDSEYEQYCDEMGYRPSRSGVGRTGPRTTEAAARRRHAVEDAAYQHYLDGMDDQAAAAARHQTAIEDVTYQHYLDEVKSRVEDVAYQRYLDEVTSRASGRDETRGGRLGFVIN